MYVCVCVCMCNHNNHVCLIKSIFYASCIKISSSYLAHNALSSLGLFSLQPPVALFPLAYFTSNKAKPFIVRFIYPVNEIVLWSIVECTFLLEKIAIHQVSRTINQVHFPCSFNDKYLKQYFGWWLSLFFWLRRMSFPLSLERIEIWIFLLTSFENGVFIILEFSNSGLPVLRPNKNE